MGRVRGLREAGRMDEAIGLLHARIEAAPSDLVARTWLGDTLLAANRPDLALQAFGDALRLTDPAPPALCGKARALAALGRPAEADEVFRAALTLDPADSAAHYGRALLAFEAGDMERASAHLARLTDTVATPADWLAARVALAKGAFDEALDAADRMATQPGLDPSARADALLLKAEVLDRLDRHREAFAAAAEGKAIQRRLFADRAAQHEGEVAKLERLAAWFAGADPTLWAAPAPDRGSEADGHVFLLGFPRSGTSLLEQALAGHSRIVALEEAPTLADHYQAFLTSPEGLDRLAQLDSREAERWRARYWASVRAHGVEPRGRVMLDKAPAGTLNLPVIAKLFPTAKILFAVRDPRDVVVSCHMNAFQMNALTYAFTDLAETARCYAACMALGEIYRRILPLTIREVRHEALLANFPAGVAEIAAFIGIEREAAMTDVARTARNRVVRTPSAARLRAGLSAERLGRWRNYATELAPVRNILAPWVTRLAYADA